MRALRRFLPALLACAAVGCGGANASTTSTTTPDARSIHAMRTAAVRLLFADANATALPGAYDRQMLRKRMRRYMASRWLNRRVEQTASSIAKVGGRRYFQSWTEAITVGQWERENPTDQPATVVFLGYDTICPSAGPAELPMKRVTVRMVREQGRWRLATYDARWLTSEGPMSASGALTIRELPERIVFHNPRPRSWRYLGPPIPDLTPCR